MSETGPTVFVVDDDEAVRSGIRELTARVGLAVRCFASAEEFLDAYGPTWHGCLLLDVRMPGMGGLKLQEELIRRDSDLFIAFLTGYGDVPMAVKALKKGAAHFVEKPFSDQELLDMVHDILQKDAMRLEHRATARRIRKKLDALTSREREVLEHLKFGESPKAIAYDLCVSRKTVDWHTSSLRGKLGVESNAQLLLKLYKAGLLSATCTNRST